MYMKTIETKRLYLRELVPADKTDLAKVLSNPESMQYYPAPFTDRKVENWINWNIENYHKYQHGLWAVIKKTETNLSATVASPCRT
jgi:RimJ/RimL family protein N-acetyltransferase